MTTAPPLGDRIRGRRVALGLTLAAVADRAGLSLPYVSNLERGRGNPTLDALTAIAVALETTTADLLSEAERSASSSELALAHAPASLKQFARSSRFAAVVQRLAKEHGATESEMRERLLVGMNSAPRRSSGEPAEEDWRRLLDVYSVILSDE
ncbi:MAG: helix-turn-helix transcriptional regulator [Ilumatobacteraceae bacterium]